MFKFSLAAAPVACPAPADGAWHGRQPHHAHHGDAGHGHHPPSPQHLAGAFPLSMADLGAQVRIVALRGGAGLDRRMTEMGLNIGAQVRVLQQQGGGLVVMRGESRFALGGGMAHRVMVTPV
ncbi:ferrous iron transport protein A [Rhodoferax sp. U2-2l]|uniref:FeoA family protein n=1 Tax=Rhodoferax sp. U2-2l TaxID=2884000 RepID=UPI001D0A5DD4|nr:FeoA family protein [Rhodoferax sp. U2-2l]MCB8746462.1 ferrous iron transport protein A [Rhodoferax sp. U2-2l]